MINIHDYLRNASNQTLGHSVKTWIYVLLVMLKFFSTEKIKEDEIKYWNINGERTFWRCCFFTKRKNLYLVPKVTFLALLAMFFAELCTASLINQIVVVFANSRMKLLSEGLRNYFCARLQDKIFTLNLFDISCSRYVLLEKTWNRTVTTCSWFIRALVDRWLAF